MDIGNTSDLVEDSLRLLDEAAVTDATFQAAARRLYEFESRYESTPTYFRIMEILERRGYFETVPLEDHPEADAIREAAEGRADSAVAPVLRHPDEEWSADENPVVGYLADGDLYVERGGELREALVEAGALEARETGGLEDRSLYGAVAEVVEAAREAGDLDLVLRWFVALGFHLAFHAGDERDEEALLEELQSDDDIARIRSMVAEVDDLEMKLHHPERNLEVPPTALRNAHPILGWWYDVL